MRGWDNWPPYLLDAKADELPQYIQDYKEPRGEVGFARGWVDILRIRLPTETFMAVLAGTPELRLLRKLILHSISWDADCLGPLAEANYLGNVRFLSLNLEAGEPSLGENVIEFIHTLPRIEELYLYDVSLEGDLFGLPTLTNLRILEMHGGNRFPLEQLAGNPALGRLTQLRIWPDGLTEEESEAHIRLPHLQALVRSKVLGSLTHLHLERSDLGDAGCQALVDSGVLARLKELSLSNGSITDAGARILAGCSDLRNLQLLNLEGNALSKKGIAVLRKIGIELRVDDQHDQGDTTYLYAEDWE